MDKWAQDDSEIEAIRARWAKVPQAPWHWNSYSGIFTRQIPKGHVLDSADDDDPQGHAWICWVDGGPSQHGHGDELHTQPARDLAQALAAAPADIATLLAAVDALRRRMAA
jgi:hypothetical protein